ncbi:putative membrane protein [Caballeronia cordobensis]|nr:putative membrane protein [Burkholderia sp. RPE67]
MNKAYLRARGGIFFISRTSLPVQGLSPRTRRNRDRTGVDEDRQRPISAHAEESKRLTHNISDNRVYLRVRGGISLHDWPRFHTLGLSPRTRRNLKCCLFIDHSTRSISAHAEESKSPSRPRRKNDGLSPRTRRNRSGPPECPSLCRSISAHAEESRHRGSASHRTKVYLRARGGIRLARPRIERDAGLSPRTRRNPLDEVDNAVMVRSISAHAEESAKIAVQAGVR